MFKRKVELGDKVIVDKLGLKGIVFLIEKIKKPLMNANWSEKARKDTSGQTWKYYIAYFVNDNNSDSRTSTAVFTSYNVRAIGRATLEELLTHPEENVRKLGLKYGQENF